MNKNEIVPKRKGELLDMLQEYDNRESIRQSIIDVIMEVREVPRKEASDTKKVRPDEVEAILNFYNFKFTS